MAKRKRMYRAEPRLVSAEARGSYLQGLFNPQVNERGQTICQVTLIYKENEIDELKAMVAECVNGEWKDKGVGLFKEGLIKNPILSGKGKEARNKETGEIKEGLGEGLVFIRPNRFISETVGLPQVVNRRRAPITKEDFNNGVMKSGDYVYACLGAYCWENDEGGKGVSFSIEAIQFVREGERLGSAGGVDVSKTFKDLGGDEAEKSKVSATGGGAASLFD